MIEINVAATAEASAYLEEMAREMLLLFPITLDEARSRINREFENRMFLSPVEVDYLMHEEQDVWARHIYYGRNSFWWLGEEGLEPRPYVHPD